MTSLSLSKIGLRSGILSYVCLITLLDAAESMRNSNDFQLISTGANLEFGSVSKLRSTTFRQGVPDN